MVTTPFVKREAEEKERAAIATASSGEKIESTASKDIPFDTPFTPGKIEVTEEPPVEIEVLPTQPSEGEGTGEEVPPQAEEEDFSLEDAEDLSESVWNVPAVLFGEHLEILKPSTDKFAKPMYRYCKRKGINPFDWLPFGEELPMIFVALAIVGELKRLHAEHKKEEKAKENREKSVKEKEEEGEEKGAE